MVANLARLEHHGSSKAPTLHPGELTAEILCDFEDACINYFNRNRTKIKEEDRTSAILGELLDFRIRDWVTCDRDTIENLSFKNFMQKLREQFLDKNWTGTLHTEILHCRQKSGETFSDYSIRVIKKNTVLKRSDVGLEPLRLIQVLEAGMADTLVVRVRTHHEELENAKKATILAEKGIHPWLQAMKRIDEQQRADFEAFQLYASKNRADARGGRPLGEPSRRGNTTPVNAVLKDAPARTGSANRVPPLTVAERALLRAHDGCYKCREFYAGHRRDACPNPWPDPSSYRTLTEADALAAKKGRSHSAPPASRTRTAPVAAVASSSRTQVEDVEDDDDENTHPVAAVMGIRRISYSRSPSVGDLYRSDDERSSVRASCCPVNSPSVVAAVAPVSADPFREPHLLWQCMLDGPLAREPLAVQALIDSGSHTVLIREPLVQQLGLRLRTLPRPEHVELAMASEGKKVTVSLYHYVKLSVSHPSFRWKSRTVRAIVTPGLCADLILGLPFLVRNGIVIDHSERTVTPKGCNFDLLEPAPPVSGSVPKPRLREQFKSIVSHHTETLRELRATTTSTRCELDEHHTHVSGTPVAAVLERIEVLAAQQRLTELGVDMVTKNKDVFEPIPHVDVLPSDVWCRVQLKDATRQIVTRTYASPRKYKEAWTTLIQEHLEAGRIQPSNSAHASPAFLIPKADPTALPRWVNDFCMLNDNTVPDAHPLPRVDDILADCAKGKIWSKMDMTNSFFQTRVHPDDVHKTAVSTPLGLYEWLVMPMGLRNAPAIHQRRVTAALRKFIGRFCHVYLDDIVIWSDSVEEHGRHVQLILEALRDAKLYCNPKKCHFFLLELDFLGHKISQRGIEAQSTKVDKILQWPVPKNATDVRAFLGLVRYIATYLPNLAEHTRVLTPLTTKDAKRDFPEWQESHQRAFEAIKSLVVSRECLTVIDHEHPGDNNIYVTCDASDWRTGAMLSFGPTWEAARPVAFDSMQLKGAELNYPIHEKELLAVIRALKKWRADLLGMPIMVYTDHRTLENFNTQKDLSRRQLRWQEFPSQYELTIVYIKGEDNTVADALSRLPPDTFPCERPSTCAATLAIGPDAGLLDSIRDGYANDPFCVRFIENAGSTPGAETSNGLWYVGGRLLVPRAGDVRERLFRLAHDNAGHFEADKSYAYLRSSYYWPNMRKDLESAYIPSCGPCQRNKGPTHKHTGPLHPLPVPDERGDSVAMDFIGELPEDHGHNCILTMTDRLHSDVRAVPTRTDITAEQLAVLFFDHWVCENGLPEEIISDRDKLFMSAFWRALHKLLGVDLKMSTAYHPQTDGQSERTNKTINQCLRFYVERHQRNWVRALPRIRFQLMSSLNASTGMSNFQLRFGRTPRIIPPLVPRRLADLNEAQAAAWKAVDGIQHDVAEAKDCLLTAKVNQAAAANRHRGKEEQYQVGDLVMLSTANRRREYKRKGQRRAAKFFPRYDGPYPVKEAHPESSTYVLDLPDWMNIHPTFHTSELKAHNANDAQLFPGREFEQPGPVLTIDGQEEYYVDHILDERPRGRGRQYLVRWKGWGPEHDSWLPGRELQDNAALDKWVADQGTNLPRPVNASEAGRV
ncbi:hypothetical protein EVJ58_g10012 [Rhodofomes roseus]|uniref:RNA-directed DNA polymerase n=1 Tax=Rhodofomes roseus TaxID=34475 RepID=A0A4Y9XQQ0_9APHY|nr:hypothetical protein EVJ58_g10012 [Rhodofomes roseus]